MNLPQYQGGSRKPAHPVGSRPLLNVARIQAEGRNPGTDWPCRIPKASPTPCCPSATSGAPDQRREAEAVYGTASDAHPGVRYLYEQVHDPHVGGPVEGIEPPPHYDFENLWAGSEKLRQFFTRLG